MRGDPQLGLRGHGTGRIGTAGVGIHALGFGVHEVLQTAVAGITVTTFLVGLRRGRLVWVEAGLGRKEATKMCMVNNNDNDIKNNNNNSNEDEDREGVLLVYNKSHNACTRLGKR